MLTKMGNPVRLAVTQFGERFTKFSTLIRILAGSDVFLCICGFNINCICLSLFLSALKYIFTNA